MTASFDWIRTWLYVPADKPALLDKALASGADAVIADLEDAVGLRAKNEARSSLTSWLGRLGPTESTSIWVRIDATSVTADLAVACHPRVAGICVPKAETVDAVALIDEALSAQEPRQRRSAPTALMLLIETAVGVLNCERLAAASPRVAVLQVGELDLRADLRLLPQHLAPDGTDLPGPLRAARDAVVFASAASGLLPPVAPVSPDFRDVSGLTGDSAQLRADGFGSRAAIHPAQLAPITAAFMPSDAEVAWATAVVDAAASAAGVAVLDGRMVDAPVVQQAEDLLRRAKR